MKKITERIREEEIIVGDGAMGTELQAKGLKSGECTELWNIEHPQKVENVHKSYVEAGSELIETNTFGANFVRLKEQNLENKLNEIIQKGVEIARRAAENRAYVAGSVGPTGKMLKPLGTLSPEKARESFLKQIKIFEETDVDFIIIETMTSLDEMEKALEAADQFNIPVIAQMNFTKSKKTVMGNSIKECVTLFNKFDLIACGINCTPGVKLSLPLITTLNNYTDLPLSLFPNAGAPELKDGEISYPEGPQDYIRYFNELINNNVKLFGGCCGSTPEIISAIKKYLNERS